MSKFLFGIVLIGLISSAKAQVGQGGGNGGNMVFVNNTWTLEDYFGSYVAAGEAHRLEGDPAQALKDLVKMVSVYSNRGWVESVLMKNIFDDAEYRFVEELPCGDKAEAIGVVTYGCTINEVTYLIKEKFSLLSNEDRIFALLHERLHAIDPSPTAHDWIKPYVHTVRLLATYLSKQIQGDERWLLPSEYKLVKDLMKKNIELGNESNSTSLRIGTILMRSGGVYSAAFCDDKVDYMEREYSTLKDIFIGVGSVYSTGWGGACSPRSFIQNSKLIWSKLSNVVISDSTFFKSIVYAYSTNYNLPSQIINSKIINSKIEAEETVWQEAGLNFLRIDTATISDSLIRIKNAGTPSSLPLVNICNTHISKFEEVKGYPLRVCKP